MMRLLATNRVRSMITLFPQSAHRRVFSRRELLRLSGLGAAGLSLPNIASASLPKMFGSATAKRCIYIFLCGGPSQIDMWDLKPDAPDTIRGPFRPIATTEPGIQIGELLPNVAKHADKFSIIRSMVHDSTDHGTGIKYMLLADSSPLTKVTKAFPVERTDHPGIGAILHRLLGNDSELPAWVTVPRAFTTGARMFKGQSAGFLGAAHDPLFLSVEKRDSLAEKPFTVQGLQFPKGMDAARLGGRKRLLDQLNPPPEQFSETDTARSLRSYYRKVFAMLSSGGASRAFDLEQESARLRDRYGRNEYGQSFLLARRLAEAGVRMVNVFWTYYGKDGCQFNLWDNHGSEKPVCGGHRKGVEMIRGDYCCPAFDRAFSALLEDLSQRGMLDDTLVVVTGEFGRTPKINKNAGRDHWPHCYSTVLAGGGVRGGRIYGASDRHAAYVQNSPVKPEDLGATILHAFGIKPETVIHTPSERTVPSSIGTPVTALF